MSQKVSGIRLFVATPATVFSLAAFSHCKKKSLRARAPPAAQALMHLRSVSPLMDKSASKLSGALTRKSVSKLSGTLMTKSAS